MQNKKHNYLKTKYSENVTEKTWSVYWLIYSQNKNNTPNSQRYHEIYRLTYPVRVFNSRMWYIRYVNSLLQVRFPHHRITQNISILNPPVSQTIVAKRKLSSLKAQVTKSQNLILKFQKHLSGQLFVDTLDNEILEKLQYKLNQKREMLHREIKATANQ